MHRIGLVFCCGAVASSPRAPLKCLCWYHRVAGTKDTSINPASPDPDVPERGQIHGLANWGYCQQQPRNVSDPHTTLLPPKWCTPSQRQRAFSSSPARPGQARPGQALPSLAPVLLARVKYQHSSSHKLCNFREAKRGSVWTSLPVPRVISR